MWAILTLCIAVVTDHDDHGQPTLMTDKFVIRIFLNSMTLHCCKILYQTRSGYTINYHWSDTYKPRPLGNGEAYNSLACIALVGGGGGKDY